MRGLFVQVLYKMLLEPPPDGPLHIHPPVPPAWDYVCTQVLYKTLLKPTHLTALPMCTGLSHLRTVLNMRMLNLI